MNKETVNNYVNKAKADTLSLDELLALEDAVLEHRMKGGNAAYTDSRFEKFKEMLPYLESEMKRKHVTLQLLWEEYRRDNPRSEEQPRRLQPHAVPLPLPPERHG